MIKILAAGIWTGLCINTITTGDVSVISQAVAQGTAAVLLVLGIHDD